MQDTLGPHFLLHLAPSALELILPVHGTLVLELLEGGAVSQEVVFLAHPAPAAQVVAVGHLGARDEP